LEVLLLGKKVEAILKNEEFEAIKEL